jgi:hypothetical protein
MLFLLVYLIAGQGGEKSSPFAGLPNLILDFPLR